MLGRTKKRELGIISDKRLKVVSSIDHYLEVNVQHDIRVSAACAAAFVAFRGTPDKVSPTVKGIMNSIKVCNTALVGTGGLTPSQNEENVDLQTRSAVAVGSFVKFCVDHNLMQPPDKIVKNLCTFLCQDAEQTPTFSYSTTILDGILSFQGSKAIATLAESSKKGRASGTDSGDAIKSHITRRGSVLAFVELSNKFGPRLLDVVPKMWNSMAGGLASACNSGALSSWISSGKCSLVLQPMQQTSTTSLLRLSAKMSSIRSACLRPLFLLFMESSGTNYPNFSPCSASYSGADTRLFANQQQGVSLPSAK